MLFRSLRKVERAVAGVGVRLHYSLFLCELDEYELHALQRRLARLIDPREDLVQYLPWCDRDRLASRHLGTSAAPENVDAWVV